jgi:AI-2 transport protein TqsA
VQQEQYRHWPIDRAKIGLWLLGILTTVAVLWVLRTAAAIFIPVIGAFFVAVSVAPVGRWVRQRVPARLSWLGHAAAMLVVLGVLAAFFGSIWFVAARVAEEFPKHADEMQRLWAQANDWIQGTRTEILGDAAQGQEGGAGIQSDPVSGFARIVLDSARQTASMLVLVVFLSLLMLVEAPIWREKIVRTLGRDRCRTATGAVSAIARQFRRYIVVSSTLGLITGAIYVLWLSLFGLDFVLLWGLLAFLLNFIPLAGSLIAGALPVMLALVQKDAGTALIVAAGLMVIEQVMGNLVAPRMEGRQLALSPLVIMISLLLWTWLWGTAGALLAAPMAVLTAIVLSHVGTLRRFAVLLGDTSDVGRFEAHTRPD